MKKRDDNDDKSILLQIDRLDFCIAWLLDQAGAAALDEVWFVVTKSNDCAYGVRDLVHGVVI
jgi:hypothetical protein